MSEKFKAIVKKICKDTYKKIKKREKVQVS